MGIDWSRACTDSLLNAGVTRPLATGSRAVLLALWSGSLLFGSMTTFLYFIAGEKRKQVWPLYGRFVLLVTLASVAGIINSGEILSCNNAARAKLP